MIFVEHQALRFLTQLGPSLPHIAERFLFDEDHRALLGLLLHGFGHVGR